MTQFMNHDGGAGHDEKANQRLQFLEQLAGEQGVLPAVVKLVCESIVDDLAVLGSAQELARLPEAERPAARAAAKRARAALDRLKQ